MPYGHDKQQRIFLNDTITLKAFLYDSEHEDVIPQASISSVTFSVLRPGQDPSRAPIAATWTRATAVATVTSVAHGLTVGDTIFVTNSSSVAAIVNGIKIVATVPDADTFTFACLDAGDPSGTLTHDLGIIDMPGAITADGEGTYTVPGPVHTAVGDYKALARFTYTEGGVSGRVKTVPLTYEVADVFVRAGSSPADPAIDLAWKRLEDCFDSEYGGPWLRDMTMANFDRDKLVDFLPTVLLDINVQQPVTAYTLPAFPWTERDGAALFGYGLFVETVRHLMRSYVEQPNVMSSQVGYFDRTKYQQAWTAIYQVEKPEWDRLRELWKRGELDISHGAMLVGSKAGRLISAPMRTRFTGRGYI